MKKVVVANQKGGVGKTSTIVHLAYDFQERGLNVVLIDLDTQGNASFTLHEHQVADVVASQVLNGVAAAASPQLHVKPGSLRVIPADDELADSEKLPLHDTIQHLRAYMKLLASQGFDVCLIDTAPWLGNSMAAALAASDFVLIPIELELYSIKGVEKMSTTVANLQEINPDLAFLGLLPSKVDARNPRQRAHLAELRAKHGDMLAPCTIGLRSSVAAAIAEGRAVWTLKQTAARKAGKEMRALAAYVHEKMFGSEEKA